MVTAVHDRPGDAVADLVRARVKYSLQPSHDCPKDLLVAAHQALDILKDERVGLVDAKPLDEPLDHTTTWVVQASIASGCAESLARKPSHKELCPSTSSQELWRCAIRQQGFGLMVATDEISHLVLELTREDKAMRYIHSHQGKGLGTHPAASACHLQLPDVGIALRAHSCDSHGPLRLCPMRATTEPATPSPSEAPSEGKH